MALFEQNRIFHARGKAGTRGEPDGLWAWVLVGVALALLGASWIEPGVFDIWRERTSVIVGPVVSAAAKVTEPVGHVWTRVAGMVDALGEAASLRSENARLTAIAGRVEDLERENAELKRLARFAGAPGVPKVTARVVARSPGGLSRTLLIGAGRNQGIRDGYPVVGGDGLAGRVVQTYQDTASVMLLADRLSRVPVYIGKQQARGLLTGTGAGMPRLEFVAGGVAIFEGDLVTTSGLGGVFPRGLAVGVVVAEGAGWRVQLVAGETLFTAGVLQVEIPASDAGEAANRKGERETAGSRLKAIVK